MQIYLIESMKSAWKNLGIKVNTFSSWSDLSLGFLISNVLLILLFDFLEFLHVQIEILRFFEGDKELGSLDQSLILLLLLVVLCWLSVSATSLLLNLDGGCVQLYVFSIAVLDEGLSCNHTDCGCISKGVQLQSVKLLESLLAKVHIERLVLSVRNVDLVSLDLQVLVLCHLLL